jgi:hypothetical protein
LHNPDVCPFTEAAEVASLLQAACRPTETNKEINSIQEFSSKHDREIYYRTGTGMILRGETSFIK